MPRYKFFENSLEDRIFEFLEDNPQYLYSIEIIARNAFANKKTAEEKLKAMYNDGSLVRQKVKISSQFPIYVYGLEFNENKE
ncbi:hypothetical protein EOM81_11350 [bacterium]|nr:hypothetical protein [bacterium]